MNFYLIQSKTQTKIIGCLNSIIAERIFIQLIRLEFYRKHRAQEKIKNEISRLLITPIEYTPIKKQ